MTNAEHFMLYFVFACKVLEVVFKIEKEWNRIKKDDGKGVA